MRFKQPQQLAQQLHRLSEQIHDLQGTSGKPLIVACDFNASFGEVVQGRVGPFGGRSSLCSALLLQFLVQHDLAATNSFYQRPCSRTSLGPAANSTDIDWILCSPQLTQSVTNVLYQDMTRYSTSDHLAVHMTFAFVMYQRAPRVKHTRISRTWKPTLDAMGHSVRALCVDACPEDAAIDPWTSHVLHEAYEDFRL